MRHEECAPVHRTYHRIIYRNSSSVLTLTELYQLLVVLLGLFLEQLALTCAQPSI